MYNCNLLIIRKENNLTQNDIAKITKVNRSEISKWENNKEVIPLKHLNTLSNSLNISIDYLVGLSKKKEITLYNKELNRHEIGLRIKKIRSDFNLSLRDLASELNTSSSTISAYETGKVLISTHFAFLISIKYNISIDWICGKINTSIL